MKKLVMVIVAVMMLSALSFGQSLLGYRPVMIVPDTATKFPMSMKAGDLVFVSSTGTMYQLAVPMGTAKNMNYVLASTGRYNSADMSTLSGRAETYFVDTATAQNVRGVKTFYNVPKFAIGTNVSNIPITYGTNSIGSSITTGQYNVLLGGGNAITAGSANIAISEGALMSATTSNNNIALGQLSLATCNSGSENIGVGGYSLYSNTTGVKNTSIGIESAKYNTSGGYNSFLGYRAGYGIKTGSGNIAIGKLAGPAGTTSATSNALYISNVAGGADTAIIYGVMGATPAASTLQFNAAVDIPVTLGVDGNVGVGTSAQNKFTVTGTNGNFTSAGTGSIAGNVGIGTTDYNKFTVDGTTGAVVTESTARVKGALTADVLPTFTIAGGTATIGVKDTVGLAVAGLTTNAIVVASYNAESTASKLKPDTAAAVYTVRAGWLTLGGKYGWKVNYFIPKK